MPRNSHPGDGRDSNLQKNCKQDENDSFGSSLRIDVKDLFLMEALRLGSIDEVENVLEELAYRGEFDFGSFWGGVEGGDESVLARIRSCPEEMIDYDYIGLRLMELFGSSNFSSYNH